MLAIGRALVTNPELLILDEATEGLAPLVREEIWRVLAELRARRPGDARDRQVRRAAGRSSATATSSSREAGSPGAAASAELAADRALWQRYLGV